MSTGGTSDAALEENEHHSRPLQLVTDNHHHHRGGDGTNGFWEDLGDDEDSDEEDEDEFLKLVLQSCGLESSVNTNWDNNIGGVSFQCNGSGEDSFQCNGSSTSSGQPLVNYQDRVNPLTAPDNNNVHLFDFLIKDGEHMVLSWKAAKYLGRLYVKLPGGLLPAGSRESFVTLLEYAEETLEVESMFVCMSKDRSDRANLLRIFMFLGFEIVHSSSCPLVPASDKYLFMCYSFD